MAGYERLGADAIAQKGWWSAHKWLLLRRSSQLGILLLFLVSPMIYQLYEVWIIKGNLASSLLFDTIPMTEPLLIMQMLAAGHWPVTTALTGVLIVLLFYLLVGGRAFCSWVCPVNIVTDLAFWLRRKLGIKSPARLSRNLRYWMLAMVVVLAFATGTMAYEMFNPVAMLHRGIIFGMGMAWTVVLGIFLFDLLVAKRGWCSHLCPMAASYGLVGKLSMLRVRVDAREACNDCLECYVVCPEAQVIKPVLKGEVSKVEPVILDGACTNCGRCIDICAPQVFQFGHRMTRKTGQQDGSFMAHS